MQLFDSLRLKVIRLFGANKQHPSSLADSVPDVLATGDQMKHIVTLSKLVDFIGLEQLGQFKYTTQQNR